MAGVPPSGATTHVAAEDGHVPGSPNGAVRVTSDPPVRGGRTLVTPARGRPWWLLLVLPGLGALLLGGAAITVNQVSPPNYTAEALLAVLPADPANGVSLPITGIWVQLGNTPTLVDNSAAALGIKREDLAAGLAVSQPSPDAPVIAVSVTTTDPRRAATWANAVAARLVLDSQSSPVPGYALRSMAAASPPAEGSPRLTSTIIAAATVLGALVGLVMAQSTLRFIDRRRRRRRLAEPCPT